MAKAIGTYQSLDGGFTGSSIRALTGKPVMYQTLREIQT